MSTNTLQTFEHVIEIAPGETGSLEFRFPKDARRTFHVTLEGENRTAGTIDLQLDNLIPGYEMSLYTVADEEEPWNPLLPDAGGEVRATLDVNRDQRIGIDSDNQFSHSLHLVGAEWRENRLRLTFQESA